MKSSTRFEIDRIVSEYRRREKEIPRNIYSCARPVNQFFQTQTARISIRTLVENNLFPLETHTLLEVGCGRGSHLIESAQWGANPRDLAGIDLLDNRIKDARKFLPGADIRCGDAQNLPWDNNSFDVVTQFTVFTSILDPRVKKTIASEMFRVLKPNGLILWYDFRYNNPRNKNVKGIEAQEIQSLFPTCQIKFQKTTLAPPLARVVVPVSWIVALVLEKMPVLCTHYLAAIKKRVN